MTSSPRLKMWDALHKHGWNNSGSSNTMQVHTHPEHGKIVSSHSGDLWKHEDHFGAKVKMGKTHEDLDKHLSSLASQHTEVEEPIEGTEQFTETVEEAVARHGYEPKINTDHYVQYHHPKGNTITFYRGGGKWSHYNKQRDRQSNGDGDSLVKHLDRIHSSQHTEEEDDLTCQFKETDYVDHPHPRYEPQEGHRVRIKKHMTNGGKYGTVEDSPSRGIAIVRGIKSKKSLGYYHHSDLMYHKDDLPRNTQHTEEPEEVEAEQFGERRTDLLGHLKEHFKQDSYEKQGGAHAYWLKPTKGMSMKEIHKHLTRKGIKSTLHEGVSYHPEHITGKHGKHGFAIEKQGGGSIHVRFHRTKHDAMGIDSDQYEEEETEEQYAENGAPIRNKPIKKRTYLDQLKAGAKPPYGHSFGRP